MKRKNISFPDPVSDELERLAQEKDVTLPDIVRMAVYEYLEKLKRLGKAK